MSSKGYIASILNQLPADQKKALQPAFDHVIDDSILGSATKAANFRWVKATGTTSSAAGTEFSIEHGIGTAPIWLVPVLDLQNVGSQMVPLEVSKVPDARRVYLKSTSTGATFTMFLEY